MEYKGKEISGRKQISAMIQPAVYVAGRESGVKWGYLIELGLKARELALERNQIAQDNEKLQRAIAHLQREILKLQEARDRAIAETGA